MRFVQNEKEGREKSDEPDRAEKRKLRYVIGVGGVRRHQISYLVQNHSGADPKGRGGENRNSTVARGKN